MSTVNLRSEANTSSSILASLSNGTAVTITGVSGGWYKVSVNGKTGYVHPDYVQVSKAFPLPPAPRRTAPAATAGKGLLLLDRQSPRRGEHLVRVFRHPSQTAPPSRSAPRRTAGTKVSVNGKSGYIKADYVASFGILVRHHGVLPLQV